MGNCLVTKLKSNVQNSNLDYLNCLKLKAVTVTEPSTGTQMLRIKSDNAFIIRTVDGSQKIGTTYGTYDQSRIEALPGNRTYYVENGDYDILVESKYDLIELQIGTGLIVNIDDLNYSGDLVKLHVGKGSYGDIKNLPNGITELGIQNSDIIGDVAAIKNWTNYNPVTISFFNTGIYGDICDAVQQKTGTKLELNIIGLETYEGGWFGDLSTLPNSFSNISCAGRKNNFAWENTRDSSAYRLAMNDIVLGDFVDAMLINQASCSANPSAIPGSGDVRINAVGTHDPSNAEAVAAINTIKADGWTVKINGVDM